MENGKERFDALFKKLQSMFDGQDEVCKNLEDLLSELWAYFCTIDSIKEINFDDYSSIKQNRTGSSICLIICHKKDPNENLYVKLSNGKNGDDSVQSLEVADKLFRCLKFLGANVPKTYFAKMFDEYGLFISKNIGENSVPLNSSKFIEEEMKFNKSESNLKTFILMFLFDALDLSSENILVKDGELFVVDADFRELYKKFFNYGKSDSGKNFYGYKWLLKGNNIKRKLDQFCIEVNDGKYLSSEKIENKKIILLMILLSERNSLSFDFGNEKHERKGYCLLNEKVIDFFIKNFSDEEFDKYVSEIDCGLGELKKFGIVNFNEQETIKKFVKKQKSILESVMINKNCREDSGRSRYLCQHFS